MRTTFSHNFTIAKAVEVLNLSVNYVGKGHKTPVRMFIEMLRERRAFLKVNGVAMVQQKKRANIVYKIRREQPVNQHISNLDISPFDNGILVFQKFSVINRS
jgi:hypothetical protein